MIKNSGAGDLLEMKNEFATLGDVSANVSVASLLTHFNHAFDLRSGEDVAFGDLRQSPSVLIGAFNNPWTLQMTGDLPFVFGSGLTIKDQSDPKRQWHPVYSSENKIQVGLRTDRSTTSLKDWRASHHNRRDHTIRHSRSRRVHHFSRRNPRLGQFSASRMVEQKRRIRITNKGRQRYSHQPDGGRGSRLVGPGTPMGLVAPEPRRVSLGNLTTGNARSICFLLTARGRPTCQTTTLPEAYKRTVLLASEVFCVLGVAGARVLRVLG